VKIVALMHEGKVIGEIAEITGQDRRMVTKFVWNVKDWRKKNEKGVFRPVTPRDV